MTGLGLSAGGSHSGEIRVGFRHGIFRYLGITVGGAGALGGVLALLDLAKQHPDQFFGLLAKWGWVWFIVLALVAATWDLAKRGMGHLGKLADSVQDSAIAMNRIADRDDRERDRMQMEIAFIGGRMEKLSSEHEKTREEMRDNHREIVALLSK